MKQTPYIILLDGPKGAGKTTVGQLLAERLQLTFLSLDNEKKSLADQEGSRRELYQRAFDKFLEKIDSCLADNQSVVLDCGFTPDRIKRLNALADGKDFEIHRYYLRAPYKNLLDRVRARDQSKNKPTDEDRFKEVYELINNKDLSSFQIIRTKDMEPGVIVEKIIEDVVTP